MKWATQSHVDLSRAVEVITSAPGALVGQAGLGRLQVGGFADVCVLDPQASWQVRPENLRSQSKHTPFAFDLSGSEIPAKVKATLVNGRVAYQAPDML
jgi:dihydroorotase